MATNIFPRECLSPDDDWIEKIRRVLYPRLHPILAEYGGYGVSTVGPDQFVGRIEVDEDELEDRLFEIGFVRNPIAALKSDAGDATSEGSWVLLAADDPENEIEEDRQLHITLMPSDTGVGLDVYAHNEYDWRVKPRAHLNGKHFNPSRGVEQAEQRLKEYANVDFANGPR